MDVEIQKMEANKCIKVFEDHNQSSETADQGRIKNERRFVPSTGRFLNQGLA
jgi:hypothetical protein